MVQSSSYVRRLKAQIDQESYLISKHALLRWQKLGQNIDQIKSLTQTGQIIEGDLKSNPHPRYIIPAQIGSCRHYIVAAYGSALVMETVLPYKPKVFPLAKGRERR